jgi:hypothetical protein
VPIWAAVLLVADRRCAAEAQPVSGRVTGSIRNGEVPMADFLKALIVFAVAFALFTLPATWLMMLFFGNIGMELSYVATLPLGILVSVLLGGVTSRTY